MIMTEMTNKELVLPSKKDKRIAPSGLAMAFDVNRSTARGSQVS